MVGGIEVDGSGRVVERERRGEQRGGAIQDGGGACSSASKLEDVQHDQVWQVTCTRGYRSSPKIKCIRNPLIKRTRQRILSIFASVVRLVLFPPISHLPSSEPISMTTLDLSLPSIIADIGSGSLSIQGMEMDDGDIDVFDSPAEEMSSLAPDQSSYEKERTNLAVYLDALPYKCESLHEMQHKLEHIIAKLVICAESKNWSVLTTWDAMLEW